MNNDKAKFDSFCFSGIKTTPKHHLLHPCHKQQQTLLSWRSNQRQTSCMQGIGGRTDHRDNGSSFQSDLKPARQLSTCNQWAGIPYRRHFRMLMYFVCDIYKSVWMLGQVTEIMNWSFHGKQHQDVVTPTYPLPSFTLYVNVSLICWSPLKVNHHPHVDHMVMICNLCALAYWVLNKYVRLKKKQANKKKDIVWNFRLTLSGWWPGVATWLISLLGAQLDPGIAVFHYFAHTSGYPRLATYMIHMYLWVGEGQYSI